MLGNVYVLPGLPSEMEAMFDSLAPALRGAPIAVWRRRYATGEGHIVHVLEAAVRRYPELSVGSYPRFAESGPEVEIVLKALDPGRLAEAAAWLEAELDGALAASRPPGPRDLGVSAPPDDVP